MYVYRIALVVLAALAASPIATSATPSPARLVNVFVGTTNDGYTFPGASAPFGMIQFSPVTPTHPGAGYDYKDSTITGFTLTRLSGTGCPNLGAAPMLPVDEPAGPDPLFSHKQEFGTPGYYRVRLGSAILVELTATTRTGMARFTFPRATGYVQIPGTPTSAQTIVGTQTIEGGLCGSGGTIRTHYMVTFNRPFTTTNSGALRFDLAGDRTLIARAAVSYVSAPNAAENLRESRIWDFDRVRAGAARAWERELAEVKVAGGKLVNRRKFYTALYHLKLAPNVFTDRNGQYLAGDGSVRTARGYTRYTNIDGWGSYRTEFPLLCLLEPRVARDVILSILGYYRETGRLGKWAYAGHESGVMIGDSFDVLIATAVAYKIPGIPLDLALAAMVKGATVPQPGPFAYPSRNWPALTYVQRPGLEQYLRFGYLPHDHGEGWIWGSASTTLEYAIDDFAISRVALAAGRKELAARFLARSRAWRHLVNPASGFIEPRLQNGAFIPGFSLTDEQVPAFAEGNAWQYTWMVPHDVGGLVAALGGKKPVGAKLGRFFEKLNVGPNEPHLWFGNQHVFHTPWVYRWLGQPEKTEHVIRRIQTELFKMTPGGIPGNEDMGQMSSWFIWSALGMYPAVPGVPGVLVTRPLFPSVTLPSAPAKLARWTGVPPSY